MTEKEKMLRQMIYDANNDTDLIEERKAAKDLCYDFNNLRPSDTAGQQRIMRQLLGKTAGDSFCIVAPFWCDYGYNIEIGETFKRDEQHDYFEGEDNIRDIWEQLNS